MVFGGVEVDVSCPSCKKQFKIRIREIENNRKVKCPHCKETITLRVEGDDLKKPDRELQRLQKQLKDLGNVKFGIEI